MKSIVFFGDSITKFAEQKYGYISLLKNLLRESGDKYNLIGAGCSGNKVEDLLYRVEQDVLNREFDIIFIYIGINDVWHYSPVVDEEREKVFKRNYQNLIERIKGKSEAKIILCTPSVIGEKKEERNVYDLNLHRYSSIIKVLAEENKLSLCDLRSEFIDYLNLHNKFNHDSGILTNDGVHLNETGNKLVADCFHRILVTIR